jgi:hypothetical protein
MEDNGDFDREFRRDEDATEVSEPEKTKPFRGGFLSVVPREVKLYVTFIKFGRALPTNYEGEPIRLDEMLNCVTTHQMFEGFNEFTPELKYGLGLATCGRSGAVKEDRTILSLDWFKDRKITRVRITEDSVEGKVRKCQGFLYVKENPEGNTALYWVDLNSDNGSSVHYRNEDVTVESVIEQLIKEREVGLSIKPREIMPEAGFDLFCQYLRQEFTGKKPVLYTRINQSLVDRDKNGNLVEYKPYKPAYKLGDVKLFNLNDPYRVVFIGCGALKEREYRSVICVSNYKIMK